MYRRPCRYRALMRDIGIAPATPIKEGVRGFAAWYREHYRI